MGKYDPWTEFFNGIDGEQVVLTFEELERALGSPLPPSARRHAAWWASAQYHAKWADAGFVASPRFAAGEVRFRRAGSLDRPAETPSTPGETEGTPRGERLILLGCVAEKRSVAAPARDLYASPLWEKRRSYSEATGQPWAILSAEHGLVMPHEVIEPYDRSLKDEPIQVRRRWAQRTAKAVIDLCRRLGVGAVEMHAGSAYLEHGLISALNQAGLRVYWPLRGKRIGEQLSWYGDQVDVAPEQVIEATTVQAVGMPTLDAVPEIVEMRRIGSFEYRWPDSTERFQYGWEGLAETEDRTVRFRHGVGRSFVYGGDRVHTVTWIDGEPVVEGVGADDYQETRCLLSLLKDADGVMIRDRVPDGYAPLQVVDHRTEIDARYSRNGLAVKIRVDDVAAWLLHATLRRRGSEVRPESPEPDQQHHAEPFESPPFDSRVEPLDQRRKRAIAEALVAFGQTPAAQLSSGGGSVEFTEDPEANAFLAENPFAFLVGVICDQGIKAERAWAIPKELERRLGHLDPYRMVANPDEVYRAFVEPNALHRYINNVPAWLISAADRVIAQYGGDAAAIWDDSPTAAELQERLRAFDGIGQKKAAMAVEMLERDLSVDVRDMAGSDVAYDVQIRRVFLRSGLAEIDDVDHMVTVARKTYPERPGALDAPAWVIGRTWCRPAGPLCQSCAISTVCAQRIDAGDTVRGF